MTLTLTPLRGIPLIHPGEDLVEIILQGLLVSKIDLQDGDILVVAQKIVSKSEGQLVNLASVQPSDSAKEYAVLTGKDPRLVELNLLESRSVLRTRPGTMIVEHRLGFVCANAGIDHSNVAGEGSSREEWVLLLPENPDQSAQCLRQRLQDACGVHG